MKLRWYLLGMVLAVDFACAGGCGHGTRTVAPPKSVNAPEASEAGAKHPVPDWAPKDPSPEFLRASELIRPQGLESLRDPSRSRNAQEALSEAVVRHRTLGYELLGSLDDKQLQQYFTQREIRIPMNALTRKQRALVDAWLELYPGDLTDMYKLGAAKDLSNVDFGFADESSRGGAGSMVQVEPIGVDPSFWVKRRDGKTAWLYNGGVGYTYYTSKNKPQTLWDRTPQ